MTQNRDTGAEASEFGHAMAAFLAEKLGAQKLTVNSNEFEWNGQRITIRTARQGNTSVGVTYAMLDRIQLVIAAFECTPDEYELFSLLPTTYKQSMRDSKGKGKVGLVSKKTFVEHGQLVARIKTKDWSVPWNVKSSRAMARTELWMMPMPPLAPSKIGCALDRKYKLSL